MLRGALLEAGDGGCGYLMIVAVLCCGFGFDG